MSALSVRLASNEFMTEQQTMTDTTNENEVGIPMGRITWGVLVTAFVVFCMICLASTIGLYGFIFRSTVPMSATLQISRGTALVTNADVTERGYRAETTLPTRPVVINNSAQTQSVLVFGSADPERGPLALLTLQDNSEIRLLSAEHPLHIACCEPLQSPSRADNAAQCAGWVLLGGQGGVPVLQANDGFCP